LAETYPTSLIQVYHRRITIEVITDNLVMLINDNGWIRPSAGHLFVVEYPSSDRYTFQHVGHVAFIYIILVNAHFPYLTIHLAFKIHDYFVNRIGKQSSQTNDV